MKTKIRKEITLTLTQNEAIWLKYVMQNPSRTNEAGNESEEDKTYRETFWDSLNKEGI